MEEALLWLQQSSLAIALKSSFVVYPLVNWAHILAIGTVVVTASLLDLRILGLLRGQSASFSGLMRRTALLAFAVALTTGVAMFTVQAVVYAANPAFRIKMLLLLAAGVNFLLFRRLYPGENDGGGVMARISALLSLCLWLAISLCGRLIAYV